MARVRVHKPRPHRILGPRQGRTVRPADIRRAVESEPIPEPYWRPAVRGDCALVPRPCPFVGCRHNVYLDVRHPKSIKLNFPRVEPENMPASNSCSLDMAASGERSQLDVGKILGVTHAGVALVEMSALLKLRRAQ